MLEEVFERVTDKRTRESRQFASDRIKTMKAHALAAVDMAT